MLPNLVTPRLHSTKEFLEDVAVINVTRRFVYPTPRRCSITVTLSF